MFHPAQEFERKNREIYDDTDGLVWRRAIYEGVHGGREFINLGGASAVDRMASAASLGPDSYAIEIGAGRGAVCCYLAERWGCQVTGVEWNSQQVRAAESLRSRLNPGIARRVEFVDADCLSWRPARLADAVLSVDMMMLLPDAATALRHASTMLSPGGKFITVTIGAGPAISEAAREFVWNVDGMASLFRVPEYAAMLSDAGYRHSAVHDITDVAIGTSRRIQSALEELRDTVVDAEGESAYRAWLEVGAKYLSLFESKQLTYLFLEATRPPVNLATGDKAGAPVASYHSSRDTTSTTLSRLSPHI